MKRKQSWKVTLGKYFLIYFFSSVVLGFIWHEVIDPETYHYMEGPVTVTGGISRFSDTYVSNNTTKRVHAEGDVKININGSAEWYTTDWTFISNFLIFTPFAIAMISGTITIFTQKRKGLRVGFGRIGWR